MDKVLKRRLIGASILIALAVIFVPMLLVDPDAVRDGPGSPVDIPPMPDSSVEVRRIPLDPEAARVADDADPQAARGRNEAPDVSRDTDAESDLETTAPESLGDEIVLRPDLGEPDRLPETRIDINDAGSGENAMDAEPSERPGRMTESSGQAESAPESVSEQAPAAAAADTASLGRWTVQVASFGSPEAADRVRTRLEALGHIVFRDEIVRGQSLLYRLRTGPYPSRSAAQTAREQIETTVSGVEPIVVAIDSATGEGSEPGFAVQVGSFVSEDNARGETARLSDLGFDAFRFSQQVGERLIWRVLVGPVPERSDADDLKSRVVEQAGVDGLVVSYP